MKDKLWRGKERARRPDRELDHTRRSKARRERVRARIGRALPMARAFLGMSLAGVCSCVSVAGAESTRELRATVAEREAFARCERVKSQTFPAVSCQTLDAGGAQAMVFQFKTQAHVQRYLTPLSRDVAWPFCAAANRAQRKATVIVLVADDSWRRWDCAQDTWSAWQVRSLPHDEAAEGSAVGPLAHELLRRIFAGISHVTTAAR